MDDQNSLPDQPVENQASILLNLESMIKTHISSLDNLQDELSKAKGLLDDIFANDEVYQKHDKDAKEAIKVRTATKQQLLKQPQAADLNVKIKSYRSQIAETQSALSDYLGEFQRISGVDEIEDEAGEMHKIVYVAKLIRAR